MKHNIQIIAYAVLMGSMAIIPNSGWAAEKGQTEEGDEGVLSEAEQQFIDEAAGSNTTEVTLSRVAKEKATNDKVREFAEHMVKEHGDANQKLKTIAEAKGAQWREMPTQKQKKAEGKTSSEEGQKYDKQYMKQMIKDHEQDISKYEDILEDVEDPELKQYIIDELPKLQGHLGTAKGIAENL